MPHIVSLHIYPIKSCRGIDVPEAALDRFGLAGDRRFLAVDQEGRLLTQRTLPALARVAAMEEGDCLALSAPGVESIRVHRAATSDSVRLDATVWNDTVSAADLGPAAADWLTRVIGKPARLVAMAHDFQRPIRKPTARTGDEAAFADAFPLLVISEASLADLNQRLDLPLPMNRFRPNVVVRGCTAFAEDTWSRIRVGDVTLRAAGPCGRCILTTTDQETLERGKEPLRTLALYRRSEAGEVNFGQNFIHETKTGMLRVNDPVEILD